MKSRGSKGDREPIKQSLLTLPINLVSLQKKRPNCLGELPIKGLTE